MFLCEAVRLIWPLVGGPARSGTFCSSNWAFLSSFLPFFLCVKERALTLSPRSRTLSFSFINSEPRVFSFLSLSHFHWVSRALSLLLFSLLFRPVGGWMAAGRQQWEHQPCAQLHHRPQQPPRAQDRPCGGDAGQSSGRTFLASSCRNWRGGFILYWCFN